MGAGDEGGGWGGKQPYVLINERLDSIWGARNCHKNSGKCIATNMTGFNLNELKKRKSNCIALFPTTLIL